MKLWTVTLDYYATGEGRTFFGWVGYADAEKDAVQSFGRVFDPFFAHKASASEGVIQNSVTALLFSPRALEEVRKLEGLGSVTLHGELHFNLA